MRWSEELQRPPAPWELGHKDGRSKCGQGACTPRECQPRQAQPRVTGAQPCPSFPVSFCPAYLIGGDPGRRASAGAHLPPLLPEPPPLWETLLSSFRAKVKSRCSRGRSLETRWGTAGCSHTHPIARPCPPVTRSSSSSGCPGAWGSILSSGCLAWRDVSAASGSKPHPDRGVPAPRDTAPRFAA